jgi:hypothetical protein
MTGMEQPETDGVDLLERGVPADGEPDALPSLDSLTETERNQWRLTGELPKRTIDSPGTAESAPAKPVDQAASTDASTPPASEPGKPARPNAETRKAELKAEIEELARQARQLRAEVEQARSGTGRAPDASAAPSPAAPSATADLSSYEAFLASPGNEGKTFEHYTRALIAEGISMERQRHAQEAQARQREQGYASQLRDAVSADPAFWDGIHDELKNLVPVDQLDGSAPVTLGNVTAQVIQESGQAPQVLRYLSEHESVLAELKAQRDEAGVARVIGRVEGALMAQKTAPAPQAPPVPVVSQAPPPAPTLGRRPAAPTDDVESAIAQGDVNAYMERMNRAEMGQ